jgi:hypothetical protein
MEHNNASKYVDIFLHYANKLHLDLSEESVVYQFKTGLSESMRVKVSATMTTMMVMDPQIKVSVNQLAAVVVRLEGEMRVSNHTATASPKPKVDQASTGAAASSNGEYCTFCKKPGHLALVCRTRLRVEGAPKAVTPSTPSSTPPVGTTNQDKKPAGAYLCFTCNKPGHQRRDCPLRDKDKK